MNVTELRDALDDLAGPLVAPNAVQRQSVRRRVRRARLVRIFPATALILAVAVGSILVVSNGTGDRPTRVVTSRDRIVHNEDVGYSVAIPRGWRLDVLQPDRTAVAGVRLIHADFAKQARETRKRLQNLVLILSERANLRQRLNSLAPESPERAAIDRRIEDLNAAEMRIRTQTDDLRPIQAQRADLQRQLNAVPADAPERSIIENQIHALDDAEVRIRSRPRKGCLSPEQTGIHISVLESRGAARRRPARFGPNSGSGLEPKRTSRGCTQLVQSMRFTDAGRTFTLGVIMATDTGPRRRAETYAILNHLRFDPR